MFSSSLSKPHKQTLCDKSHLTAKFLHLWLAAASNPAPIPAAAAGMGMLPFFPNQHIVGQALPGPNNAPDKAAAEAVPGAQPFPQALPSLPAGALRAGHSKPPSQLKNSDSNLGVRSMQHKYCLCLLSSSSFSSLF